jgi:hypothetical protein
MLRRTGRRRCCARNWPSKAGGRASGHGAGPSSGWATAGSGRNSSWDAPIRRTPSKNALAEQAALLVAAGGAGWFGDETTVREFPPRRAWWAKRGQQRAVVLSGRNARRGIHGALHAAGGEFVSRIRARSRQDDCLACVEALGQIRPTVAKLLVWDTAPPHHPQRVAEAAAAAHITRAGLPFRSPERMPGEDLWRLAKAQVAANRP